MRTEPALYVTLSPFSSIPVRISGPCKSFNVNEHAQSVFSYPCRTIPRYSLAALTCNCVLSAATHLCIQQNGTHNTRLYHSLSQVVERLLHVHFSEVRRASTRAAAQQNASGECSIAIQNHARKVYLVILVGTMREVESSNRHAGFQELAACLNAAGHRPKSAHYLQTHNKFRNQSEKETSLVCASHVASLLHCTTRGRPWLSHLCLANIRGRSRQQGV